MPGKNKHPLLGWHCPGGLADWARAEAKRRSVPLSVVLTEAVAEKRDRQASGGATPEPQKPAASPKAPRTVLGYSKERQTRGRR